MLVRARRRRRRRLWLPALVAVVAAGVIVLLPDGRLWWTSPPAVDPGPAPLPLPERVVGGYWMKWADSDSGPLASVPEAYNTIYLAFAQGGSGSGDVRFEQGVQTRRSFRQDVDTVRGRGQRLILSVGGEGGLVDLSDDDRREEFVTSVRALRQEFPFDGIDWDVEGQALHVENMAWASRRLKAAFGADFAVTMAPQGDVEEYRELAERLGDDLDLTAIQYYDYPEDSQRDRVASVKRRTRQLIEDHGLSPSQIGIGMRVHDAEGRYVLDGAPSRWFSLEGSKQAWRELRELYPEVRGVFLWEIAADQSLGGRWVDEVAPLVAEP